MDSFHFFYILLYECARLLHVWLLHSRVKTLIKAASTSTSDNLTIKIHQRPINSSVRHNHYTYNTLHSAIKEEFTLRSKTISVTM